MKIVVLAGGYSPERDVSLSSGALIANALMENGHEVLLLDLYLGLREEPRFCSLSSGERFSYAVPAAEPELARLKAESGNGESLIGPGVVEACRTADLVFLGLHGSIGENGQIQALFDCYGIRYTGSGYAGSLLAMDKELSKKLMRGIGIRTPDWWICRTKDARELDGIPLPCVVKPCACGSSIGVSFAETREALLAAVEAARVYEDTVLIEERIAGREFSVGILEGKALPAIEIIPKEGFYDYKNKYQPGRTEEVCPAAVDPETERRMQDAALALHRELRLGSYSRTDFLLDGSGELYCLEANTLPGMTPTSLLPQEAKAAGISYERLCEKIALAALG